MDEDKVIAKLDELTSKVEKVDKNVAVLNESVKYIGQELRTRTDVIFKKLEDHEIRIRTLEGDVKVISKGRLDTRLRFLETWQAKLIGASAVILLIANLGINLWRLFR